MRVKAFLVALTLAAILIGFLLPTPRRSPETRSAVQTMDLNRAQLISD